MEDHWDVIRYLLSAEVAQVNSSGIWNSMDNSTDIRLLEEDYRTNHQQHLDCSNQSMHLSEDSFNLSTFCISQEDFNSLDTNSQSVIQLHLDIFSRIERQFEQQN